APPRSLRLEAFQLRNCRIVFGPGLWASFSREPEGGDSFSHLALQHFTFADIKPRLTALDVVGGRRKHRFGLPSAEIKLNRRIGPCLGSQPAGVRLKFRNSRLSRPRPREKKKEHRIGAVV